MRAQLLTLALIAAGVIPVRADPWTMQRAIATGLSVSPDAQSAQHRIEAAQAMVEQVTSAWRPQFAVTGGYAQTNNALVGLMYALNQRNFDFGANFNRPGWVDSLSMTGTLTYNLYEGGKPTAQLKAARAVSRAAEQDWRATQNQLAAEIVKAMLGLRKARESVATLEAGVKAHEAGVANARLRFEAGQMLKADLLSLEVQTTRTREMLSTARQAAALAARTFVFILGLDDDGSAVELPQTDSALAALNAPAAKETFSRRPELLGLNERIQAAEAHVEGARGARRPSVNAYASSQFDHGWQAARHGDSLRGGVMVDLNVFDGGRASGRIRQAMAELAQAKSELRKLNLRLTLEAEQARLGYTSARERLAVSQGAVAQAEESAALSRARFEQGVLLASELIASETRLIETKMSRAHAEIDERITLVEWHRALGLPLLPPLSSVSQ